MFSIALSLGIGIVLLAFFAEYMDSSLGMGYGTSLTPLLLLLGFDPMQIVPAILLSEFITGLFAALTHTKLGNVNFALKDKGGKMTTDLQIALILAACSIVGAVSAVFVAISIPKFYLKLYIGILILSVGVFMLINKHKHHAFSWKRIIGLGIIASFNKGMSGGGYGPLVTGGQILSGVEGKNAVAITSLAESLTCFIGLVIYMASGKNIDFVLAPYLIAGAIISVPLSGLTVKRIKTHALKNFIGYATVFLGCMTLYKIF